MPALPGSDDFKTVSAQAGGFGDSRQMPDVDSGLGIQPPGLAHEREGRIKPNDRAAAQRESARDGSRARSQIQDALTRSGPTNAERGEALKKRIGEARAMAAVVLRGLA